MEIKKFSRQGFLFSFRSTYDKNGYATVSLYIDGDEVQGSRSFVLREEVEGLISRLCTSIIGLLRDSDPEKPERHSGFLANRKFNEDRPTNH